MKFSAFYMLAGFIAGYVTHASLDPLFLIGAGVLVLLGAIFEAINSEVVCVRVERMEK